MKRSDITIIIIAVVAILGLLIYFFSRNPGEHFSWTPDYRPSSSQPYGTAVISEILPGYFKDKDFEIVSSNINSYLESNDKSPKLYLFIGEYPFYSDSTAAALAAFVAAGNEALIATTEIPEIITERILYGEGSFLNDVDSNYYIDNFADTLEFEKPVFNADHSSLGQFSAPGMTFNYTSPTFRTDKGYRFVFRYKSEPEFFTWNYFLPEYLKSNQQIESLGSLQSKSFTGFIRIPHGKGYFYLYVNPVTFTNLFLLDEDKLEYNSKLFSYFKPADIIWDQYSMSYSPEQESQPGPLTFILSNESLRWAWYMMIIGLALFILFRIKRTQQSIPVMEPNENKSLEFVQTIGRMYYLRRNHHHLAAQKMKLFQHFVQEKYQLGGHNYNEEFIQKLHMKSEVPIAQIREIYSLSNMLDAKPTVSDQDIILLHNTLDYFYKHCK